MATGRLKQYCLTCKDVAHFECACCDGHTPYCSKACQRADYASIHKFESSFFTASTTTSQEEGASQKEGPVKQARSETKASMEDRWIRAEFHRIAHAVEETYNEWKREPAPKSSLDELTKAQRESVMATLKANFNNQTVNEDRARERKRYTAELSVIGEKLAEHIPMKDGSKRTVLKLNETPQLREGLARFFRMNDLAAEKQKLVFMRNSEKDREEYTDWLIHTEEYQKKFILYWLFADDGVSYETLQRITIEEERRSLGVAAAEQSYLRYKEEGMALLVEYLAEEEEEELLFHGLTPAQKGADSAPTKEKSAFKEMMDHISKVIGADKVTDFTAKGVEFMTRLWDQSLANQEANYANDTTNADQRDTGFAYVNGLFKTLIEKFKLDMDDSEGEMAKLKRELVERFGVSWKTIRKTISPRTLSYYMLTVTVACAGGFVLGYFSHVRYSITPALQVVIDKLTDVKNSIANRLSLNKVALKDVEDTSLAFQDFATGVHKKTSIITTMRGADLTNPSVVTLIKSSIRTLMTDIDKKLLAGATYESTQKLHDAYRSLREQHIQTFLETPDGNLAKKSLDAIVEFLQHEKDFLKSVNVDTDKFINHVSMMGEYFKRTYVNIRDTVKDLSAAETMLETITGKDLPSIMKQADDDDFNAGCTRAFMGWIGKAHLLTGSLASHAFDAFVMGNSNNIPNVWARGALDLVVMLELKAKNFYRSCASYQFNAFLPFIASLFTGQLDIMIVLSSIVSVVGFVSRRIPEGWKEWLTSIVPNPVYTVSNVLQGVNIWREDKEFDKLREKVRGYSDVALENTLNEGHITIREYYRLLLSNASDQEVNAKAALHNWKNEKDTIDPLQFGIRALMLVGTTTRFVSLLHNFYAMASTCAVTVMMSASGGNLGETFVTGVSYISVPLWVYMVYKKNVNEKSDKSFIMQSLAPLMTLYDFYRSNMIYIEMGLGLFEVATGLNPMPLFSKSVISNNTTIDQLPPANDSYIKAVNYSTTWDGMKETYANMHANILAKNFHISEAVSYLKEGLYLDKFKMDPMMGGNHT